MYKMYKNKTLGESITVDLYKKSGNLKPCSSSCVTFDLLDSTNLLHIVASFSARLNKHYVQLFSLPLALFNRYLPVIKENKNSWLFKWHNASCLTRSPTALAHTFCLPNLSYSRPAWWWRHFLSPSWRRRSIWWSVGRSWRLAGQK